MSTPDLISYVLFAAGLLDFIVVPRMLLHVWDKRGQRPGNAELVVRMLRVSGFTFIGIGALIYFRIIPL
jgi:hypothetical protein